MYTMIRTTIYLRAVSLDTFHLDDGHIADNHLCEYYSEVVHVWLNFTACQTRRSQFKLKRIITDEMLSGNLASRDNQLSNYPS